LNSLYSQFGFWFFFLLYSQFFCELLLTYVGIWWEKIEVSKDNFGILIKVCSSMYIWRNISMCRDFTGKIGTL
jgi:hypothetical protein